MRQLANRFARRSARGRIGVVSVLTGIGLVLSFGFINLIHISGLYGSGNTPRSVMTSVSSLAVVNSQSDIAVESPRREREEPQTEVITTSSWMVLTDEFLDNLRKESFWAKRGGPRKRSSSRPVKRSFLFGNVLEDRVPPLRKPSGDGGRNNWDKNVNQDVASNFYSGSGNTYRTVCVRTCDGSYSPVSFSTTRSNFRRDERKCKKRNGRGGRLYVYRNPGGSVDDMVDLRGRKYSRLPTAFLFRAVYKSNCKSKPHPWQIASLDRHKLYRMKAGIRKLRGQKRRRARLAMRQFKRSMKERRVNGERRVVLASGDETKTRPARGTYTVTSASQAQVTVQRVTSLSPIRSLALAGQPNEHLAGQPTVIARSNAIVLPDNDDNPIFLPARSLANGAIALASRSTRSGSAAITMAQTTSAKLPAAMHGADAATADATLAARRATHSGGLVRSTFAQVVIIPDNDDTPILLPIRNMFRDAVVIASDSEEPHDTAADRRRRLARANNRNSRMSLGVRKPREVQQPEPRVKAAAKPRRSPRKPARSWQAGIFASQR